MFLALVPLLLLAAPSADPEEAAQTLCSDNAQCEGYACYERARCREVRDAPFQAPKGSPTFRLHAVRPSDGEGTIVEDRFYGWNGRELVKLFDVVSDSGGDGPHTSLTRELVVCREVSKGVPVLEVRTERTRVEAPTTEAGKWTRETTTSFLRYSWNGKTFDQLDSASPCVPKTPPPPPWLESVTASSTLVEKSLDADYYAPSTVADGRPETAWAEGAKGPGVAEWLELRLAWPMAIARIELLPGCGVNARLWSANQRLKKVTLVFSDGTREQHSLPDSGFGKRQSIPVEHTARTTTLRLVIDEVFKARFEDACISEIVVVAR